MAAWNRNTICNSCKALITLQSGTLWLCLPHSCSFALCVQLLAVVSQGVAQLTSSHAEPGAPRGREVGNLGEGMLEGGKALMKGFLQGATGIVTKPVEGAERAGFSGFFQGVAKVRGVLSSELSQGSASTLQTLVCLGISLGLSSWPNGLRLLLTTFSPHYAGDCGRGYQPHRWWLVCSFQGACWAGVHANSLLCVRGQPSNKGLQCTQCASGRPLGRPAIQTCTCSYYGAPTPCR